jgi:hypothetical protein
LLSFDTIEKITLKRGMSQAEKALFDNDQLKPNISVWAKNPLRFGAAFKYVDDHSFGHSAGRSLKGDLSNPG